MLSAAQQIDTKNIVADNLNTTEQIGDQIDQARLAAIVPIQQAFKQAATLP